MRTIILPAERDLARAVADRVCAAVRAQPDLVLGLPTGRTVIPIYRCLAAHSRAGQAAFGRVTTFNLDEFAGLAPTDPGSYHAFMATRVFEPLGIDRSRAHVPDGMAPDLDAEARRYEAAIEAAGGIDLLLLGIGRNGHIGFNEPAPALVAYTHVATLRPQTRRANARFFGNDAERVPARAISMGMATILSARRIVLVASGAAKRRAVAVMLGDGVTTRVPASFLQLHRDVDVVMDEAAASGLPRV